MKIIKNIGLSVAGFFTMMALWLIGSLTNDYIFRTFDDFPDFFIKIPMCIACAMPVLLIIFAVVGKRFNLKALYISAFVGMVLPVIGCMGQFIFSDDGNILSWIYMFTIGLMLSPFSQLAFSVFDGVDSYFFVYHDMFFERDYAVAVLMAFAVTSVIIFLVVKKRNKKPEQNDFIQEAE